MIHPRRGSRAATGRPFVAIALVLATLLIGASPAVQAVGRGEQAPAFVAPALDGQGTLALADFRGQIVYLDFWASWCPPCLTSMPLLDELRKEFAEQGFEILAVNVDRDPDQARRHLQRRPVGYPSATDPDGRLPEQFGVATMPTSFLIDRDGVVRHVHQGFRRSDVPQLRERIRSLLEQP